MTENTTSREAWWQRSLHASLGVAGITAVCLLALYVIIGHIPLNDGAGWDGSVYLEYLQILAAGGTLPSDPYRTIRLSGFLPLIGAASLGANAAMLLKLQTLINILLASAAAGLLHDTLRHLGINPRVALLTLATTLASWVFLVMPVFYPLLSDHIALPLSCLSLWCWARSHRKTLYLALAFSVWLMPGLFLIPLALAAFPRHCDHAGTPPVNKTRILTTFAVIALCTLPLLTLRLLKFSDGQVMNHSSNLGGETALLYLRYVSTVVLLACIALVLLLMIRALFDSSLWKSLNIGSTVAALLVLGVSAGAMFTLIDWSQGFTGPPLTRYMLLQSLAAPFKPLVAHLLAFGPVSIMAIGICIAWGAGRTPTLPKALLACMLGFLPLLLIGSESRQWIGILPIATVLVALSGFSLRQRLWSLLFVIVLALPAFWLHPAITAAIQEGASFQSTQWQFYFGRQGPWMSTTVYKLGMIMLLAWGLGMAGLYILDRRTGR